jgi:hypothetical protein
MSMDRERGPVEILCREIGFKFHRSMETEEIFVAFVGVLVEHIDEMRAMQMEIGPLTVSGALPSPESGEMLVAAKEMLTAPNKIERAAQIHLMFDNPDDAPCDHMIEMLSSCASAVRFGLETPCNSRHAADAAGCIWKQKYGLRLFDSFTNEWQNDWARAQLQTAILRLALATPKRKTPAPA